MAYPEPKAAETRESTPQPGKITLMDSSVIAALAGVSAACCYFQMAFTSAAGEMAGGTREAMVEQANNARRCIPDMIKTMLEACQVLGISIQIAAPTSLPAPPSPVP